MRIRRISGIVAVIVLLCGLAGRAEVKIVVDHNDNDQATADFKFKHVPPPAKSDAAAKAKFTIVDGERDPNGGEIDVLNDGKAPTEADGPSENFFFNAGTDGGRIAIDLGRAIEIRQIDTYSWHPNTRAPQVYKLYASDGKAEQFNPSPKNGTDPASCGWKLIASVDTRPKEGDMGGQYAVSIANSDGVLGKFRYLLFDISRTEDTDPFGNTFYSEIDVIDKDAPAAAQAPPTAETAPAPSVFHTADGKYEIIIDASRAPDLKEWADQKLAPVVQQWYPKIIEMLPSEGFTPPQQVRITFITNLSPRIPAATGPRGVVCNAQWFARNMKGEAIGAVVHELVHVVQHYRRARDPEHRNPGWLVEGIADYVRWFKYEPQSHGAEITRRNFARAKYDASYRVTANFLDWVTENRDKQIVEQLNAAMRQGKYEDDLWKQYTGKTAEELGQEWKQEQARKLGIEAAAQ